MDCSDGVCGTCKCRAESGTYDLGDDYIPDALSEDEAAAGLVLTCQMRVTSDCVLAVPVASRACKVGQQKFVATLARIAPQGDATVVLELDVDPAAAAPAFLPGQYVNIAIPGSGQTRAYSFSSAPGERRISFLIKKIPGGVMSTWLEQAARNHTGADRAARQLLSAGSAPAAPASGAARALPPSCPCWRFLARAGSDQTVHLIYGVTRDLDLVLVDEIAAYARRLPNFTYRTVVADAGSRHARTGWVTDHMPAELLHGGRSMSISAGRLPWWMRCADIWRGWG